MDRALAEYARAVDIQRALDSESCYQLRSEIVGALDVFEPGWGRLLEKYGLPGERTEGTPMLSSLD
jgi:hypothetical protein